ncbi:uncharacterized protein LOC119676734, partial [Teleopsis dalmanni]|uniref:uncharacterized protein LOC119676734 n=1 Tax=Teleopsis dalmanni TaxID=139649 RepID=UPI0018CDC575
MKNFCLYGAFALLASFMANAAISNNDVSKANRTIHMINTDLFNTINLKLNTNESQYIRESIDFSRTLRIRDVLNFFDIAHIASSWSNIRTEISTNCSKDTSKYIQGLVEANMWAVKMDDASGHYTSGFFYGNNYWMGSLSLCKSIHHENTENISNDATNATKNSGLPFAKAHTQVYNTILNENPPFFPSFYIVKMFLNETYPTNLTRTIYMGLCLPSSCSIEDVRLLMKNGTPKIKARELQVLDVR